MTTYTDPDIGKCDDCGSEEGRRWPQRRRVTIGGVFEDVRVWLCAECRHG